MNENLELLLQEIENNPENLLTTLIMSSDYTQETDLEGPYNDWIDATRILLRKLKSYAGKSMFSESVEIIDDVLDNMQ